MKRTREQEPYEKAKEKKENIKRIQRKEQDAFLQDRRIHNDFKIQTQIYFLFQ